MSLLVLLLLLSSIIDCACSIPTHPSTLGIVLACVACRCASHSCHTMKIRVVRCCCCLSCFMSFLFAMFALSFLFSRSIEYVSFSYHFQSQWNSHFSLIGNNFTLQTRRTSKSTQTDEGIDRFDHSILLALSAHSIRGGPWRFPTYSNRIDIRVEIHIIYSKWIFVKSNERKWVTYANSDSMLPNR